MSLTKLFNFKYLFQNIKKSKMAITLFFIIVPIFTSLMLITLNDEIFEYAELGIINIFAMYIIPFILSFCLFGYVFKKSSVDFIGSMPISRKSIFATNTLGGIVIIVLMQLTTLLLTLLISSCMKLNVFVGMAFDLFIYQTIAYIFVFIISNLAMSVSGNIFTQIVVTLLITFLIPFSVFFVISYDGTNAYAICNEYGEIANDYTRIFNYTAPSLILSGYYDFNSISLWKMIALSIAYFVIGLFMFDRRKMEIAGESFENKVTHLVVKGLTLVPLIALLITLVDCKEGGAATIVLTIITIYFFIYDLITSKKIKFKDNIIALVLAVVALYGTYSAFIKLDDITDKEIKLSSINSAVIELGNKFNVKITDKELIKEILSNSGNIYNKRESSITGIDITINTKFGGKYTDYGYVEVSKLDKILKDIYPISLDLKKVKLKQNYFKISKEEENKLFESLNDTLNGMKYSELQNLRNAAFFTFSVYDYRNHELVNYNFPIDINEDVYRILIKSYNEYAYGYIQTNEISWFDVMSNNELINSNNYKGYYGYEANVALQEFIRKHYSDEIQDLENIIFINGNRFKFCTDKVDEFINEVYSKYEVYEDEEYIEPYDTEYLQQAEVGEKIMEDIVEE